MLWGRFQCRHGDGWKRIRRHSQKQTYHEFWWTVELHGAGALQKKTTLPWLVTSGQDFTRILDSGRTNQWDHAVHQWDVLVLQTLHVAHNVGLRVVTEETKRKCTFEWKITFTHSKKSQKFSPDWQIFFKLAKKKKNKVCQFFLKQGSFYFKIKVLQR